MQSSDITPACDECTNRRPNALEQIGEDEKDILFDGKAQEVRSHFVCRHCGAKWVHLVESGLGGHGNFWSREY